MHPLPLGTAMEISGAAIASNMSYRSSPVLSFLLTLFNARLGWWLRNPGEHGKKTYQLESPMFALRPLLAEAFGQTDRTHPYALGLFAVDEGCSTFDQQNGSAFERFLASVQKYVNGSIEGDR